jgi:hypothetical protein
VAARLDWPLILACASLGLVVGLLVLLGALSPWAEFVAWLVVGLGWVVILHFRSRSRFFLHGALAALIGTMAAVLLQVVFVGTYLDNNPDVARGLAGASTTQARLLILGTGTLIAAGFSLVTGACLWFTFPREVRAAAKRGESSKE